MPKEDACPEKDEHRTRDSSIVSAALHKTFLVGNNKILVIRLITSCLPKENAMIYDNDVFSVFSLGVVSSVEISLQLER